MRLRSACLLAIGLVVGALLPVGQGEAAQGDVIWTRQFGTEDWDQGSDVATDGAGVFVGGHLSGDAFLRRYDLAGKVVWARRFGIAYQDDVNGVAVNTSGVYVAGTWGYVSAFVRKYSLDGALLWARPFEVTNVLAEDVAVDETGVYVTGMVEGTLPGGVPVGLMDAYLRKYSLEGDLLWTRQFGGAWYDWGEGVAADATGVYVTGWTDENPGGQFDKDVFVRKYGQDGTLLWDRQFGTDGIDEGDTVAVDETGVYVAGWTAGNLGEQAGDWPGPLFVRKYTPEGTPLWTRQFGSPFDSRVEAVATDGTHVLATGVAQDAEGYDNTFVRSYDTAGALEWERQFRNTTNSAGGGVAVDGSSVYVLAQTEGGLNADDILLRKYDAGSLLPSRLVVFVEGVTSGESCAKPSPKVLGLFDYIKTLPEFGQADFRVFSYHPSGADPNSDTAYWYCGWAEEYGWDRWPDYGKPQTCGSIDDTAEGYFGHSHRFWLWLKAVSQPYDEVYVLAHSMGGTVVTYALAAYGLPAKVKAVVTLDSPLAGQPVAEAHGLLPLNGCQPADDAYDDLDPGWPGEPAAVVTAIQNDMSMRRRMLVTAIGNNEDLAVWASNSHLPGAWLNLRINKGCASLFDHHCVFTDTWALQGVRESLLNPYNAGSRNDPELAFCDEQPANVVGSPSGDNNVRQLDDLGVGDEDDRLFGSRWADVIAGLGGRDTILGGDGNDLICGGDEADRIFGGPGDDRLLGEAGNDTLFGGTGLDTFVGGPGTNTCDPVGLEVHTGC